MFKIYFYPRSDFNAMGTSNTIATPNPYELNFINSLLSRSTVTNTQVNKSGVIDFFKYLFKANVFILNWIENLPVRRYGKLQVVVFSLFLFIAKIIKKKIVWILHNRYSHDRKKNKWTDYMFHFMMKNSDLIITHSSEGIEFALKYYPKYVSKVKYFIHPVQKILYNKLDKKVEKFDLLIWGDIHPYKGILEFLKFVKDSKVLSSLKILIVGKCLDQEYRLKINPYLSENIIYNDKYYDLKEITNFANQAKFTLFTYKPESVLSSGSLMETIAMGTIIIGPNIGAFKDLSSYGFIKTYNSYSEIIDIFNNYNKSKDSVYSEIEKFCHENSWDLFGNKLFTELNKVFR
jgi:beta-1,4-mannosyltransferase